MILYKRERSKVRYTTTVSDGDGKSHTETRYSYSDGRILQMDINLGNIHSPSVGKRYRFPFQVQLPSDVPSSMYVAENHSRGGFCTINYKIKAELKGQGGMFGMLKDEQLIDVKSLPVSTQPVPNLIPPITQNVHFLCCFNVGRITMGARVENTRVGIGESAVIDFACQNQSRQNVSKSRDGYFLFVMFIVVCSLFGLIRIYYALKD